MLLLSSLVIWFFTFYRPSGQERWGDGAILFYAFYVAYPITLLFTIVGAVLAHIRSRRFNADVPSSTRALGVTAIVCLISPWIVVAFLAISDQIK
jgi:heme/copper-type cytochrome/quinol oxidase subunit 2